MEIKCERCNKEWDYTGKNNWYAVCPDCRKYNKIKRDKNE
jgi:Zn finger protein HypA/HybF involved in hydrogenase expression